MTHPDTPTSTTLRHTLRARHVAMISIGGAIGAGLFVGASAPIATAGPGVLLSYVVSGLIVLFVTRMMAEMAVASPETGSFLAHIRRALGDRAFFAAGWLYWLMWSTILAIEVIASAGFLSPYIPLPYMVIEAIVMAVMTAINLLSVRGYGEFEYWFSVIKLATIAGFILIGLCALSGLTGSMPTTPHNFSGLHTIFPHGGFALLAAIPAIMLTMAGSEIATLAAVESDNPARNVAAATRTVALRILVFYVGAIAVILGIMPWAEIVPGQSPFLAALTRIHMGHAGDIMTGVMLIAALSALNSGLYVSSRTLFELAEYGDAPKLFLTVGRTRVPQRAVLASCAVGFAIAIIGALSPDAIFAFLVTATGTVTLFEYILITVAHMRLRKAAIGRGEFMELPMWGYPWLSSATLGLLCCTLVTMAFTPQTRMEIVFGVGMLGVVLGVEWVRRTMRRTAHVH